MLRKLAKDRSLICKHVSRYHEPQEFTMRKQAKIKSSKFDLFISEVVIRLVCKQKCNLFS